MTSRNITLLATALTAGLTGAAQAQFVITPATNVLAGSQPSGATFGDFDGDGDLDIATTVDGPDRVVTLVNNGAGVYSLGPAIILSNSSSPQDIEAGDWDGDGDTDLAVAVRDPAGAVVILTNNGGVFTQTASIAVGERPRGLDVADHDNDGDMDIAVANRDSNNAHVLTNTGGAFSAAMLPAGGEPRDTAFGDFNGDGMLDLAVTNHDDRTVNTYSNSGGVFTLSMTLNVGQFVRPEGVVAADLDGDGDTDLAVATSDQTFNINAATIFVNTGAGFSGPFAYDTAGSNTGQIIAADLDCDGLMDLVTSNNDSANISLLRNTGGAVFGAPQLMGTGTSPSELAAADIDGDGDADIATANGDSNNVSIFTNETCTIVACPGDIAGDDGMVNIFDLLELLGAWGPNPGHPADIDGNGTVDVVDLLVVLGQWGACP